MLKSIRKIISDREKVPPYIVFPDSTLRELSEYLPQDHDAMLKIKGVGEAKLKRYGDEFLEVIKRYSEENGLKSIEQEENIAEEEKIPSHILSYNMYKCGKP
ncbi:hypothetical protein GOM49_05955 [Clostridium bovifaecis]|uniref:HRDC domain-containing protein n=1 Tax=Clostridium bovifaecis TaxID=2184719 RepID=A0A6I6EQK7_9CLOT|nr:hypothetical protein GOM49_05955 [Clostridium bovifaecis]